MEFNYPIIVLLIIVISFGCNGQEEVLDLKNGLLIENGTIITAGSAEIVHAFTGKVSTNI